jgi:peptide deformylase
MSKCIMITIHQVGEPVLHQTARELTTRDIQSSFVQNLIETMKATMYQAPGVGLAAPQLGESLQLAVLEDRAELLQTLSEDTLRERERQPTPFQVIINPKIIIENSQQVEFFEGCLSVEGLIGLVPRYRFIKIECLNEKAEPTVITACGWHARILQHEIDHLQGTLYLDHIKPRSLMSIENYVKYWRDKPINCVCDILKIPTLSTTN